LFRYKFTKYFGFQITSDFIKTINIRQASDCLSIKSSRSYVKVSTLAKLIETSSKRKFQKASMHLKLR